MSAKRGPFAEAARSFGPVGVLCAMLVPAALAHADPGFPDFNDYSESRADYGVHPRVEDRACPRGCIAFSTPSGFVCGLSVVYSIRVYLLDCRGPKPGVDGTTLSISWDTSEPPLFEESPSDVADEPLAWLGQPVRQLPSGQRIGPAVPAEDNLFGFSCLTDETWPLACAAQSDGRILGSFAVTNDGRHFFKK